MWSLSIVAYFFLTTYIVYTRMQSVSRSGATIVHHGVGPDIEYVAKTQPISQKETTHEKIEKKSEEQEQHQEEEKEPPFTPVHVFYYPWYANKDVDGFWSHWNHRILPHWDKLVAAQVF